MHSLVLAAVLSALGLHAKPCTEGKTHVPALCGTFGVYENRATRSGRIIPIAFVLLKAKHPSGHVIYFNGGGPGEATAQFAPFIADGAFQKEPAALRDRYDILLMDNRGMGGSHGFNCNAKMFESQQSYFLELWPSKELAACRAGLLATTDLSAYTTDNAMDDLDDLRAALGYSKIVLDGDSYGTFDAFIYMRRHPGRVESAVLDGVAPPSFIVVPLEDAGGAQTAIDSIIAACKADQSCNAHFPQFAEHFAAVAKRFENGPVTMRVLDLKRKHLVMVQLSKQVFADRLRQLMYRPGDYVPYIIEQAYRGNYVPLGMMVDDVTFGLANGLDFAVNLSYTCAEQVPFITEADVVRTSADSFLGDARVRAQQRACAIWNVQALPASFNTPVRSDAPILMISGSADPASPAQYAAAALPYLPNARRALVHGAGHVAETDCTDALKVAFVRAGSAKALAIESCTNAFKRPAFKTSMKGFE
jgi:pimeloyl-ACP methyl ester carboxylesterase